MAYLILRDPGGRRVHELKPLTVLGRSSGCDIPLDDSMASKRHLEIREARGAYTITDLESTNGTLLGGERLEGTATLEDGDAIVVGATTLVFTRTRPSFLDAKTTVSAPAVVAALNPETGTLELPVEQLGLRAAAQRKSENPTLSNAGIDVDMGFWLRSLYRMLREANACETEESLFAVAARILGDALPGATVAIHSEEELRFPDRDKTRRVRVQDTPQDERLAAFRVSLLERARERCVAVLSPDIETDARNPGDGPVVSTPSKNGSRRSLLIAPLLGGQSIGGYIVAERSFRPAEDGSATAHGPFTQAHLEFVVAAAYPLSTVLANLRRRQKAIAEVQRLRQTVAQRHRIVGESAPIQAVHRVIEQVAPIESHVLVLGESGTGKELVARSIHALSERRAGPLEVINCGALPENLIESELFGHIKGSFTGATNDRPGYFELAQGGTLFLDEIGELPLAAQAKLLRVLEERKVRRVGDSRLRDVDCRIVAATHRDLPKEVAAGRFRQDLFFRLDVLEIRLPPLRERLDDLPLLSRTLLEPFGKFDLLPEALAMFKQYRWPGNVRELRNTLERMAVMARRSDARGPIPLTLDDVPLDIRRAAGAAAPVPEGAPKPVSSPQQFTINGTQPMDLATLEREYARWVLDLMNGNKSKTAKTLGIQRSTLYAWTDDEK